MSPLFFFMGILFGYVWLPDFGGMVVGGLLGLLLAQLMALSQRLRELTRDLEVLKSLVEPATDAKAQVEQNPVQNPAQGSGQQGSPPVTPEPISAAASVLEAGDGSQGLVAATGRAAAPEQTEPVADARVKITDSPPLKDYQPAERELTAADRVFAAIKSYFTEGNLFVRVGVLVLFFGVAFLLNYAAEQGKFPIELRIAAIAAGGVALLVTGWRLRVQRTTYGLILQGAGVGVLYFTVYGSFRLYHLVPTTVAFPLMFLIGALAALLAVLQNARGLVVLGIAGGFLAPVLTSTGAGSHVALFSYYAFLNAAIVAIAWFRSWRMLNLLGFAFTFIIGTVWGVTRYRAEFFASTEPFLVLFFLLYVAIGYLFSIHQKPDLRGLVDGTLIFGTPLVGIALQASLVHRFEYGLAWSAAVLGVFYLVLAVLVKRRANAQLPLLGQAYLALGVIFSSMAVPYAADGQTTVAVWALEGAAILWLGARQQQLLARLFALLLQLGAGVVFLLDGLQAGFWPFFDAVFVSAILLAAAGLFSSWLVSQEYAGRRDWEKSLYPLLLVWGLCWWFGGFAQQLEAHYHRDFHFMATLAITLVTAAGFSYLARRLRWNTARTTALTLPPLFVVFALLTGNIPQHLGANGGWWVWPLAFVTYYLLLWRGDQDETKNTGLPWLHAGTGLLLLVFIGWEGHWHLVRVLPDRSIWLISFWALPPLVALSVMVRGNFWPLLQYRQVYLARLGMPLIGLESAVAPV